MSSTIGRLILSGDLYEGNFKEWRARTQASLKDRGLSHLIGSCAHLFNDSGKSWSAATHIRCRISQALLRRVANKIKNDPYQLKFLEKLATPFRFFDLPPEIRNAVYEFALPAIHTVQFASKIDRDSMPPLLHANSQVCREALVLFYSTTTLQVMPFLGDDVD